eukprot:1067673-Amorphochlora_amoeboformis.AAC.1
MRRRHSTSRYRYTIETHSRIYWRSLEIPEIARDRHIRFHPNYPGSNRVVTSCHALEISGALEAFSRSSR